MHKRETSNENAFRITKKKQKRSYPEHRNKENDLLLFENCASNCVIILGSENMFYSCLDRLISSHLFQKLEMYIYKSISKHSMSGKLQKRNLNSIPG